MTKLLIFDYDNTTAQRNSPLSQEMITIFSELLKSNYIAILTGGRTYNQLRKWIVNKIPESKNLLLCIEYGNIIYRKNPYWKRIYLASQFNTSYKKKISQVWKDMDKKKYGLELNCGDQIISKKTLLSIRCLPKDTQSDKKAKWDSNMKKRLKILKYLRQELPFDVNIYITGENTIEFTEIGGDKGSNIRKLSELVNINMKNIEFFGDEFTKYGNDYPVLDLGIKVHQVKNPKETLSILKTYL